MYFFINPASLPTQNEVDSYGPISIIDNGDGTQSSVDPSLKYNITSKFELTNEAKAFACVDGQLIVQQSSVDNSLVNLIIKPCFKLNVPIEVEYYIYRGILKSSLIDEQNNCILPQGPGVNDLINRIWQNPPSDISYGTLGYDDGTINGNINIEDIFNFLITGVDSIYVEEGEWFGTFSNTHKIGFEVILKTNKFSVNLDYVRGSGHEIDVTNLSGFNERVKREEILNFIDPAALYGMHFNERVKYYDPNAPNNTQTTNTNASSNRFIYTKLIENFYSGNKVYIDIRSEKGYSYNFYQNYKDLNDNDNSIQLRTETNNAPLNGQQYNTDQWPILILTATHSTGNENSLKLSLRIDDNTKPILYTETTLSKDKGSSNNRVTSRYFKTVELIDNGNNPDHTAWTNMFRILFPNTQSGTSRKYVSNYVKMNYYRSEYNQNIPNTVLKNEHYYDSSFCSIDIPTIGDVNAVDKKVESSNPIYVREPNNDDGTGNFQLNMINGSYWDNNRILFYSTIQYENTDFVSEKEFLNTFPQKLNLNSSDYNISELRNRTEIICREYEITSNDTIRIPGINFFRSSDLGGERSLGKNHKENAMLMGLTVDELNSLKNDSQLSDLHQRFIYLEPDSSNPFSTIPDTDNDNAEYRYYKYTVQLQGLDSNGNRNIITPLHNSLPITVYSRDNQFFSSTAFSVNEPLTAGQNGQNEINRIEFHIFHNGFIKINDNIDFALPRGIENIYYFYHADIESGPPLFSEICNLEMVMANKMENGVFYNSTVHGPTTNFTLNHINHQQDAINAGMTGVNAHDSYENINGDVLTDGYFTVQSVNAYRRRFYKSKDKRTFLINVIANTLNNAPLTINFSYHQTVRNYAMPELLAAVLGALISFGTQGISSTGFSYRNSTCYPSTTHVNGEAIDTRYRHPISDNQAVIDMFRRFGFTYILKGEAQQFNILQNATPFPGHNDHLHSGKLVIRGTIY